MIRQTAPIAGFDLFEDMMTIARLEAAITMADHRKAPAPRDFTRLARYVPGLRV